MHPGMVGAIIGTVLGVLGGAIGTYVSLRNARSEKERRFLICCAVAMTAGISLFLGLLFMVPADYRFLVWIPYAVILPASIRFANSAHAKLLSEETPAP